MVVGIVQGPNERINLITLHVRVPLIAVPDIVIELDDVLQCCEQAVVHIGRRQGQVSQRRRPKGVWLLDGARIRFREQPVVSDAQDVELEIGKHRPVMAIDATYLLESLHAAYLQPGHGVGFTPHIAIVGRIVRDQAALKGGQGLA